MVVTTEWMVVFCLTFCSSSAGWILKDCRLEKSIFWATVVVTVRWEVLTYPEIWKLWPEVVLTVPETFPLGAVWRFVVMLGAGTASVLPVTAPLT